MLKTLLILIFGTLVIMAVDLPLLIKRKSLKELVIFFVLLSSGFSLCLCIVLHVQLPSLVEMLGYLYGPVYQGVMRLLS